MDHLSYRLLLFVGLSLWYNKNDRKSIYDPRLFMSTRKMPRQNNIRGHIAAFIPLLSATMDQENLHGNLEDDDKIPLRRRVKKSAVVFYKKAEKKSTRYLCALIFLYFFVIATYKLYYSDWLNVGQAEQRQLVDELARPYPPKDPGFRNLTWTYSSKTDDGYLLLEGRFNFTSCFWSCFQTRGMAASIHSFEETNVVLGLFGRNNTRAWFGLAQIAGKWKNVDNSKMDYTNWYKEEPKNKNGKKFCAKFNPLDGTWESSECNQELSLCLCKDYGTACHA